MARRVYDSNAPKVHLLALHLSHALLVEEVCDAASSGSPLTFLDDEDKRQLAQIAHVLRLATLKRAR